MIRVSLIDGSTLEVPRTDALELLPYRHVFTGRNLKAPVEGLMSHRGKLVPVLGPLPLPTEAYLPVDKRPWILLLQDCAQVIQGLPEFVEQAATVTPIQGAARDKDSMLSELDRLLKSA